MKNDAKLINHLLIEAGDSSGALANLNRLKKSFHDHWSMQFVCKKVGIPSTGYFSDVLKGKRTLHPKYIAGICKAYGLSKVQSSYFETLVSIDQDAANPRLSKLKARLSELTEQMQMEVIAIPKQLSEGLLWHILVLSSFSLFPEAPTQEDLARYFGRSMAIPLQRSLHKLEEIGLVQKTGDRYSLPNTRIIFSESEDGFSHLEFLEKSILHAASQVKHWFPTVNQSLFLSTIVTVNKKDFEAMIPEINSRIYAMLGEMNRTQGDQLVEFNLQVFPFDPKIFEA